MTDLRPDQWDRINRVTELVKHEGDKEADAALNDLLNGWKVWCKELLQALQDSRMRRPLIRCAWCQSEFHSFDEWTLHVEHPNVCDMFRDSRSRMRR